MCSPPDCRLDSIRHRVQHGSVNTRRSRERLIDSSSGSSRPSCATSTCPSRVPARCWSRSAAPARATPTCTSWSGPRGAPVRLPVHARTRERRLDRGARRRREGLGGRRGRRRVWPVGLRPLPRRADAALETQCERAAELGAAGGGLGLDGGMAEYMLVPRRGCSCRSATSIRVDAAPLSDAALTPYHAIKLALPQLMPGTTARGDRRRRPRAHGRAAPARPHARARDRHRHRRRAKLELAREVGADASSPSGEAPRKRSASSRPGRGATLVLDWSAAAPRVALARRSSKAAAA